MTNQIEIFSVAIEHKQAAIDAMQSFEFQQAKTELQSAREIDPYLADIPTLLRAVDILLNLGLNAGSSTIGLAQAWQDIYMAGADIARTVNAVIEPLICTRMVELLPPQHTDFADARKNILHIGYCHLVLHQYQQAHKKLLDYLTANSEKLHPALWGYFGDAAYRLNRHDESNSGYMRALFTDAQTVDLSRIQHPDLKRIFKELQKQHPEETARALLPIQSWLEEVVYIPRGNTLLASMIGQQRFNTSAELLNFPVRRYHQFALCLYIDQSGLHGDIDFDAREKMQRLDRPLFRQYLRKV